MKEDLFSVENRVVVITGGMGQLGRQFAHALNQRGAKIAVLDINVHDEQLRRKFPEGMRWDDVHFVQADVTNRPSVERGFAEVKERFGVPHGLINNAALDAPPNAPAEENGPVETYPESSWDQVMKVNIKGVFLCCQVFGAAMAGAGRGSIINISSIYGIVSPDQRIYEYRRASGIPFFKPAAYSVSKSAILNLTRYLSTYWAERNVRVNTLTFGGVFNNQDERFLEGYHARVPLARMAREDEYNGAVIFLVSDASSYMTGSNMILDGGWTAL